jgi:transposase InsO family protein
MLVMKEMVMAETYRHMPVSRLSLFAARIGKVVASASTWGRLIRRFGWCRPRQRVHPEQPKVGLRALAPNVFWHVDYCRLRLLNGSVVYIHALLDNFSRRILGWRVRAKLAAETTAELIVELR